MEIIKNILRGLLVIASPFIGSQVIKLVVLIILCAIHFITWENPSKAISELIIINSITVRASVVIGFIVLAIVLNEEKLKR